MQEQRVTKEQAIRLKNAGYPTKHPFHVDINGNSFPEPEQIEITISEATRWLREIKGWHVVALPRLDWSGWKSHIYTKLDCSREIVFNPIGEPGTHDTALSAGIDAVLTKIEKEVQNG